MSETTRRYIQEDIEELERLKKLIPKDDDNCIEIVRYQEFYHLFNTTLKIAAIDGTITEAEASRLRRKYARYGE